MVLNLANGSFDHNALTPILIALLEIALAKKIFNARITTKFGKAGLN
jgi:hypothetical protein